MKKNLVSLLVMAALIAVGCGKSSDDKAPATSAVNTGSSPYGSVNGGTCVPLQQMSQSPVPFTANNLQASNTAFYAPRSGMAMGVGGAVAGLTFTASNPYAGQMTLSLQNFGNGVQNNNGGYGQAGPLIGSGMLQLSNQVIGMIISQASFRMGGFGNGSWNNGQNGNGQNGQWNNGNNTYNLIQSLCIYSMEFQMYYQIQGQQARLFGDMVLYVGTTGGQPLLQFPVAL